MRALAGEMSGHIFFKERWYGFDDGIYAGARLLEILAGDRKGARRRRSSRRLPTSVSTPELKVAMRRGRALPLHRTSSPAARSFDGRG